MSSDYTIINCSNLNYGGIEINESSNKLSLSSIQKDGSILILTEYIEPQELMMIFLEGIKVCSYWMDSEKFKETLNLLEDYSFKKFNL